MSTTRLRSLGAALMAVLIAAVLGLVSSPPSVLASRAQKFLADIALLADDGWIMGGTGNPLPDPAYLDGIETKFLSGFPGYTFGGLSTPEQFCPVICSPPFTPGITPLLPPNLNPADFQPFPQNLTFGSSVATGAGILNNAIGSNIGGSNVVFGYSQSATVATVVMQHLLDVQPAGLNLADQHFVLVGDPNDPLSGMLTRFTFPDGIEAFSLNSAPQHLPFLNVPLSIGATPTGPFPTDIYTAAYDGWANFPQDPTNLPAVLNAIMGILTEHGKYPFYDPSTLANAITLGQIDSTTVHMIPTDQLPLLWPVYQLGDFGKVLGHALQPGLELGINWGYGNAGDLAASQIFAGGSQVVGPWAANASGELATGSGLAGFISMMDPLQMFAGIQDAGVHSFLDPVNDILGFAGLGPVPGWLDDALHLTYDLTNTIDQFLLSGWADLVDLLQDALNGIGLTGLDLMGILGPDAIFDGLPLISGAPVIDAVGLIFNIFNFFGA